MKDYININEPDEGDTLVMEDSNDSPSLMLVLSGTVELSQLNPETNEPSKIHKALVGGILCQLQTLTNEPSFYTVKATMKDTKVARLDAKFIGITSLMSRSCLHMQPCHLLSYMEMISNGGQFAQDDDAPWQNQGGVKFC